MSNFNHQPQVVQKLTSALYTDELEAMRMLENQSKQPGFEFGLVDPISPTQFQVVTFYRR